MSTEQEYIDTYFKRAVAKWHLHQAAPDLLAVVQDLLKHNEWVSKDDSYYCFDETAARAAIAKATGGVE